MNTPEIQRKATILYYNLRIGLLGLMMRLEDAAPVTPEWKAMARRQCYFIQQRNHLRTPAEIAKLEKRRGLS